jgi:hypothetical protein
MAIIQQSKFVEAGMDLPLNMPVDRYRLPTNSINNLLGEKEERSVLIGRTTNIGQADPKYSKRFGKHLRDLFIAELTAGTNTTSNFPIDQIPDVAKKSAVLYDIHEEFNAVSQAAFLNTQGFLGLAYLPFFSNCAGSGRHISISKVFETDPLCNLVKYEDTISVSAYPWKNQLIPVADLCNSSTLPVDQTHSIGNEFFPTWQGPYNGALFDCQYEEQIDLEQTNLRWYIYIFMYIYTHEYIYTYTYRTSFTYICVYIYT